MSQQELDDEETAILRTSFNHFDKNGDGTITAKEIGVMLQAIGQNPTQDQIDQMIRDADTDKTGTLNFEEFVKYVKKSSCCQTKEEREKELRRAFNLMDKNGNGFISEKELRKVLKGCGERLTDEEISDMMAIADSNEDGKIDYEEFVRKMVP